MSSSCTLPSISLIFLPLCSSSCSLRPPFRALGGRSRLIAVVDGRGERRERGEMEREDERVRRRNDGVAVRPPLAQNLGIFFFSRRVFRCSRRESCEMDEGEEQRGRTDEWGKKRIQINDKLTWKPRVAAQIIIVVAHSAIAEGAGGGCFSCRLPWS